MNDGDRLDRLESLVESQQETIERQRERIDRLEGEGATPPDQEDDRDSSDVAHGRHFSRRGVLQGLGIAGLAGFGAGTASAAEPRGIIGTDQHPVERLYLDELAGPVAGGSALTTLAGDGLSINDGSLIADIGVTVADFGDIVTEDADHLDFGDNLDVREREDGIEIEASDSNTRTDVSDDGTEVVRGTHDIDFGANLVATDDGDGSATVDADVQAATNWEDGGSNLLTTSSPFSGIEVANARTDRLNGDVTGGTDLTNLLGNGLTITDSSLGIESGSVNSAELENDSVTIAGNSVSLGGSTPLDHADLDGVSEDQHHAKAHDHSEADVPTVPTDGLSNDSVTVAGNPVSLGGSTGIDHGDLNGTGVDDHHAKDHDHTENDVSKVMNAGLANDSVTVAGNTVSLGGSTGVNAGDLQSLSDIAGRNLSAESGDLNLTNEISEIERIEPVLSGIDVSGFLDIDPPTGIAISAAGHIDPFDHDEYNLGGPSYRWNVLHSKRIECETLNESSDARLKTNVADLTDGLDRLELIRPVSYEWKAAGDSDQRLGFLAQELETAVPEAVSRPDDEDGRLSVSPSMVTAVAVSAIKEQMALIDDLEAENDRLRERVTTIEEHLDVDAEGDRSVVADD